MCPIYNEPYVGFDEVTGKSLCNGQIFSGQYTKLKLNAIVCREIQTMFDQTFEQYLKSINQMKDLSTESITRNLQSNTKNFFNGL